MAGRPRVDRRDFLRAAGASALAPALGACGASTGKAANEITFVTAKMPGASALRAMVDAYNAAQGKYRVTYRELPPPSASTQVHQQLVQTVGRQDSSVDVFTQDIVWIAEFADAGWVLPLDDYLEPAERAAYFPGVLDACTYRGKLVALPWYVDAGLLYYRKDLLERAGLAVPRTWDALADAAARLPARFGFLWQGKQAEVMICDAVEFITSAGGAILGDDGRTVRIADRETREAVRFMADTVGRISPAEVLSWDEEPSRRPFTAGQAAFCRHWTYVYEVCQDPAQSMVADRIGTAPLPGFQPGSGASCLGGYQLGINASSRNKEAAVDFARWLSSASSQFTLATELGLAPSRRDVYADPALARESPFMVSLAEVLAHGTPRPVTPKYPQLSLALQSALSRALTYGNVDEELRSCKSTLETILGGAYS